MSVEEILKQERQFADALYEVLTDERFENAVDELLSHVRVEQHSMTLVRAIHEQMGIEMTYDALLDHALEDARIEQIIAEQHPNAAEAVRKLRAEFGSLPVDGLKALRMLIDSAIHEKEG